MLLISCDWQAVHHTNRSGGCGWDGRTPTVSGHHRQPIVVFRRIGILPRQHVAKAAHFLSHFYVNPNRSFIGNGSIDLQREKKRNERRPSDAKQGLEIKMSSGSGCRVAHRRRRGRPFQIGRPYGRHRCVYQTAARSKNGTKSITETLRQKDNDNCRIADCYDFFFYSRRLPFVITDVDDPINEQTTLILIYYYISHI